MARGLAGVPWIGGRCTPPALALDAGDRTPSGRWNAAQQLGGPTTPRDPPDRRIAPPVALGEVLEMEEAEQERSTAFALPNFLISTLLIIGLFGTLLAFRQILGRAPKLVDESGSLMTSSLQSYLEGIYGGFDSAFSASLAGIGCTVALVLTRAFVLNSRARLFAELNEFTRTVLIPVFVERRTADADAIDRAARNLTQTSIEFRQATEALRAVQASAVDTAKTTADAGKELRKSLNAAASAAEAFGVHFGKDGVIVRELTDFAKAGSHFTTDLAAWHNQHENTAARLSASSDACATSMSLLGERSEQLVKGARQIVSSAEGLAAVHDRFLEKLFAQLKASTEAAHEAADSRERAASTSLARIEDLLIKMNKAGSDSLPRAPSTCSSRPATQGGDGTSRRAQTIG